MLSDSAAPPLPVAFADALEAVARSAREAEEMAARVEYTRLFHSPRGAPCPPWECVVRDEVPHLMGPRHFEVLESFRRAGVEPRSAASESADHVGTELAFLSLLAERMDAGEDHAALFAEFWAEHVATWMPRFAKGLAANARHPLYGATADLLRRAVTLTGPG
jgi:TorA maturation chaperone TorD